MLFAVVVSLATLASCSKSYNCHCVYKDNGTVSHEDDNKINEGSKDKSAESCAKMNSTSTTTLNGNTYTSTVECTLQ